MGTGIISERGWEINFARVDVKVQWDTQSWSGFVVRSSSQLEICPFETKGEVVLERDSVTSAVVGN